MPVFNEQNKRKIAEYYETIDAILEHHNDTIHAICKNKILRKYLKPITEDMENYLIKKPNPDEKYQEVLINDLKSIVESELRILG